MLIITEYIVILWMLPATLLLIFPLCIFAADLMLKSGHHIISRLRAAITKRHATHSTVERPDLRKYRRFAVKGLRADISDGITTYNGLVANISKLGLCLKEVPEKLSTSRSLLSVIIRSSAGNYTIVARPRWDRAFENRGKIIGFEIARSPANWDDFVLSH